MFRGIFHRSPEQIAADAVVPLERVAAVRLRHEGLLLRAATAGLDVGTITLLIQLFGPLAVALIELLLKRLASR